MGHWYYTEGISVLFSKWGNSPKSKQTSQQTNKQTNKQMKQFGSTIWGWGLHSHSFSELWPVASLCVSLYDNIEDSLMSFRETETLPWVILVLYGISSVTV